jgi:hypothetical protein
MQPIKAGHKASLALSLSIEQLIDNKRKFFAGVENPRARELADEIERCLDGHLKDIEDLIAIEYGPHLPQAKSCGANADGGGGFQPGNSCASNGGSGSGSGKRVTAKVSKTRQRQAVEDYTTDKFQSINAALRNKGKVGSDVKRDVEAIDAFLKEGKKYKGATVRSFDFDESQAKFFADTFKEGNVFSDPAYVSTRKKPTVSDKAAFVDKNPPPNHVVLRVNGKSGVDVSDLSKNPGEQEVLFPRDTKFRVDKVFKAENGSILAEITEV